MKCLQTCGRWGTLSRPEISPHINQDGTAGKEIIGEEISAHNPSNTKGFGHWDMGMDNSPTICRNSSIRHTYRILA
jgi:hypothetical protein